MLLQKRPAPDDQRGSWAAIIVLSVVIVGAAFWFVGLQVFVIKSLLQYRLTAHVCGLSAALLCLANIPYATEPDTPMWTPGSGKRGVPRNAVLSLVLVGIAGIAVLAGGQILVQKERNVVKVVSPSSVTNQSAQVSRPAEIVPETPGAKIVAPRTLALYDSEFVLKFDEVPMLGSPDAPHIIVCLLDYTCVHCRALYPILTQMSQQYSNQLGIVCLPVSLAPQCNPYMPGDSRANPDACEYACTWRWQSGAPSFRSLPAVQRLAVFCCGAADAGHSPRAGGGTGRRPQIAHPRAGSVG